MRKLVTVALVAVAAIGVVSLIRAEEKKSIKDVMKAAHVGGEKSLIFKIAGGKGTKEDAEKLVALYKDLAANTPKKGEEASWKEKTEAMIKAAEAVVNGDEGAPAKLKATVNCMNCHKEHRGK